MSLNIYEIETQFVEDVSGEGHYKFKGGRDIAVSSANGEAQALAAASLWLSQHSSPFEVLLPQTIKEIETGTLDLAVREHYRSDISSTVFDLSQGDGKEPIVQPLVIWVEKQGL